MKYQILSKVRIYNPDEEDDFTNENNYIEVELDTEILIDRILRYAKKDDLLSKW